MRQSYIIALFGWSVLFWFNFFYEFFYSKSNRYAQRKIWGKRSCPKCKIRSSNHWCPFHMEQKMEQVSTPHRSVHKHNNHNKQHNGAPILTFVPYPLAKVYKFVFYFFKHNIYRTLIFYYLITDTTRRQQYIISFENNLISKIGWNKSTL